MDYQPEFIEQSLVAVAEEMADEYDAALKTLDRVKTMQRKALNIQKEVSKLCNHAGLNGFGAASYAKHMILVDKRFQNVVKAYPKVTAYYNGLSEEDRGAVVHYLRSLYFMAVTFLQPWQAELACAESAGDVSAVFELKLKIQTVCRVLEARKNWWQENAAHLPAMPEEICSGGELSLW